MSGYGTAAELHARSGESFREADFARGAKTAPSHVQAGQSTRGPPVTSLGLLGRVTEPIAMAHRIWLTDPENSPLRPAFPMHGDTHVRLFGNSPLTCFT
jgi:hypothetical protein